MGVMAASSFIWWVHGVLPHAWIQFVEANENVLAGVIIPETAGFDISEDYRLADRLEPLRGHRGLGGRGPDDRRHRADPAGLPRVQKQYPKSLAAGEVKPEAGGYK